MSFRVEALEGGKGIMFGLKVIPGAKRTEIAGEYGDRLKVRVAAPPEGGRANAAVIRLIARKLGLRESDVRIIAGQSSPLKTVEIRGIWADTARAALTGG